MTLRPAERAERLQQTLDFIRSFRKERHMSPSLEEIAEAIYGSKSKRSAQKYLVEPLIKAGYLYLNEGQTERALLLTWKGKRKDYTEETK